MCITCVGLVSSTIYSLTFSGVINLIAPPGDRSPIKIVATLLFGPVVVHPTLVGLITEGFDEGFGSRLMLLSGIKVSSSIPSTSSHLATNAQTYNIH